MKYKTIKWVLATNIKNNVNTLWTWDREENNFTQIYQNYNDKLPIYTANQLLELIEKEIKLNAGTKQYSSGEVRSKSGRYSKFKHPNQDNVYRDRGRRNKTQDD